MVPFRIVSVLKHPQAKTHRVGAGGGRPFDAREASAAVGTGDSQDNAGSQTPDRPHGSTSRSPQRSARTQSGSSGDFSVEYIKGVNADAAKPRKNLREDAEFRESSLRSHYRYELRPRLIAEVIKDLRTAVSLTIIGISAVVVRADINLREVLLSSDGNPRDLVLILSGLLAGGGAVGGTVGVRRLAAKRRNKRNSIARNLEELHSNDNGPDDAVAS